MEEKTKEFKKARTVRSDYITEVKDVQNWIKDAELKIQDRSVEPHLLNEHLQKIQSEILNTADLVEKLTKNGRIIIEKSRDDEEKAIVQSSIDNLTDQLQKIRSLLDEKKQQVNGAQDAWKRFLTLYEAVMAWVTEKEEFLKEPLVVSTLGETKQKLHDYGNVVKSCKVASKNLSDMAKELDHIANVTSVGDLPQKMEEAEEAKVDVESKILARNSLLQETAEEWEQCEKKMKDVKSWIEKTKSALDSPQNKKKPLRDQHALREKLVNDCQIQKTKIGLSVDKLQLHFRSGIGGDSKIAQSAEELCQELDELNVFIKDQSRQLETAIAQVDQYQLEVQQLRQQILQVEQQLRSVINPTQLPQDSEQLLRDQQALLVQKDQLKWKINAVLAEIREIDPYNEAKGLTYAEIVAGQLLQQQQARERSEKPTALQLPSEIIENKPQLVEKIKEEPSEIQHSVEVIEQIASAVQSDVQLQQTPTIIAPEIDTSDFIRKEAKPKPNRRGRSPNKREEKPKSKIPKKIVDNKRESTPKSENQVSQERATTLKAPEDGQIERKRARSPIWIPGSTTYAEILMGSTQVIPPSLKKETKKEELEVLPLRKIETSQQTDAVENVEFIEPTPPKEPTPPPPPAPSEEPPEQLEPVAYTEDVTHEIPQEVTEKHESNVYVSIESQSWVEPEIQYQHPQTTYELPVTLPQIPTSTYYQTIPQQNLPPGMYGCIQPVPDLVGFIASGQQLMSSGLGTYHSSNQYPNIPVYSNQPYQQYYNVEQQEQQQAPYTYSSTSSPYVREDVQEPQQQGYKEKRHKSKETKEPKEPSAAIIAQQKDENKVSVKESKEKPQNSEVLSNGQYSYAQILSHGLSTEQLQPSSVPTSTNGRRSQSPSVSLSPKHSDQLMPTDDRSEVTSNKRDIDDPISTVKLDKRLTTKTKKRYAYIEPEEPIQSDEVGYRGELDVKSSGTSDTVELVPDENKPPTFSDTDKQTDKQKKRKKTKPRKSSKDEIDKALKEIQEITEIRRKGHRKDSQSSQQDLTSDSAKPEAVQKRKSKNKSEKMQSVDSNSESKENVEIIKETSTADEISKVIIDVSQKKKKHKKKKSKQDGAENDTADSKLCVSETSAQKASSEETLNAEPQKKNKSKKRSKHQQAMQIEQTPEQPKDDTVESTTQKESLEETFVPPNLTVTAEVSKKTNIKKKSKKPKTESENVTQEITPQKTSSEETLSPTDATKKASKKSKDKRKRKSAAKPEQTAAESFQLESSEPADVPLFDLHKQSSEEAVGTQSTTREIRSKSKKKKKSSKSTPVIQEAAEKPVTTETQTVVTTITEEVVTTIENEPKPLIDSSTTLITEEIKSSIPVPKSKKSKKKSKPKEKGQILEAVAGITKPFESESVASKPTESTEQFRETVNDIPETETIPTELVDIQEIIGETQQTEDVSKKMPGILETSIEVFQSKKDINEGREDIELATSQYLTTELSEYLEPIETIEETEDTIIQETVVQNTSIQDIVKVKDQVMEEPEPKPVKESEKPKKKSKKQKTPKKDPDVKSVEYNVIERPEVALLIDQGQEIVEDIHTESEIKEIVEIPISSPIEDEPIQETTEDLSKFKKELPEPTAVSTSNDATLQFIETESVNIQLELLKEDISQDISSVGNIEPQYVLEEESIETETNERVEKAEKPQKRKKGKSKDKGPKVTFQTVSDPISFQTPAQETEIMKIERVADVAEDALEVEQTTISRIEISNQGNPKKRFENAEITPSRKESAKSKKEPKKKKKEKIVVVEEPKKDIVETVTQQNVEPIQEFAQDVLTAITPAHLTTTTQETQETPEEFEDMPSLEPISLDDTKVIESITILSNEDPNTKVEISPTVENTEQICSKSTIEMVTGRETNEDASVDVDLGVQSDIDQNKTNKFILITHEEIKMQPVVSLKMEITTSPEIEVEEPESKLEEMEAIKETYLPIDVVDREKTAIALPVKDFTQISVNEEQNILQSLTSSSIQEEITADLSTSKRPQPQDEVDRRIHEEIEIEQAIFGSVKDRSRGKHLREISNEFISLESAARIDQSEVGNQDIDLSKSERFDNVTDEVPPECLARLESTVDVEISDISEIMDVLAKKKITGEIRDAQVTSPTPSSASSDGAKKKKKKKSKNKAKKDEVEKFAPEIEQPKEPISEQDKIPIKEPLESAIPPTPAKKKKNKRRTKEAKLEVQNKMDPPSVEKELMEIEEIAQVEVFEKGNEVITEDIKDEAPIRPATKKLDTSVNIPKPAERITVDSTKTKNKNKKSKKKKGDEKLDSAHSQKTEKVTEAKAENTEIVELVKSQIIIQQETATPKEETSTVNEDISTIEQAAEIKVDNIELVEHVKLVDIVQEETQATQPIKKEISKPKEGSEIDDVTEAIENIEDPKPENDEQQKETQEVILIKEPQSLEQETPTPTEKITSNEEAVEDLKPEMVKQPEIQEIVQREEPSLEKETPLREEEITSDEIVIDLVKESIEVVVNVKPEKLEQYNIQEAIQTEDLQTLEKETPIPTEEITADEAVIELIKENVEVVVDPKPEKVEQEIQEIIQTEKHLEKDIPLRNEKITSDEKAIGIIKENVEAVEDLEKVRQLEIHEMIQTEQALQEETPLRNEEVTPEEKAAEIKENVEVVESLEPEKVEQYNIQEAIQIEVPQTLEKEMPLSIEEVKPNEEATQIVTGNIEVVEEKAHISQESRPMPKEEIDIEKVVPIKIENIVLPDITPEDIKQQDVQEILTEGTQISEEEIPIPKKQIGLEVGEVKMDDIVIVESIREKYIKQQGIPETTLREEIQTQILNEEIDSHKKVSEEIEETINRIKLEEIKQRDTSLLKTPNAETATEEDENVQISEEKASLQPLEEQISIQITDETISEREEIQPVQEAKELTILDFVPQDVLSPTQALSDGEISGEELICREIEAELSSPDEAKKVDDTFDDQMKQVERLEEQTIVSQHEFDISVEESVYLAEPEKPELNVSVLDFIREEIRHIEEVPIIKNETVVVEEPAVIEETKDVDTMHVEVPKEIQETDPLDNIETLCGLSSEKPKYDLSKINESEAQWIISRNEVTSDFAEILDSDQPESTDKLQLFFQGLETEASTYDLSKMLEYESLWYMSKYPQTPTKEEAISQEIITTPEKAVLGEIQPPLEKIRQQEIENIESPERKLFGMIEEVPRYDITTMVESETDYFIIKEREQLTIDEAPIALSEQPSITEPVIDDQNFERIMAIISEGKQSIDEIVNEFVESTQIKDTTEPQNLQVVEGITSEQEPQYEIGIPDQTLPSLREEIPEKEVIERVDIKKIAPAAQKEVTVSKEEFTPAAQKELTVSKEELLPVVLDKPQVAEEIPLKLEKPTEISPQSQKIVDSSGTPKHFMYDVLQFNINHNNAMTRLLEDEIEDFAKQSTSSGLITMETVEKQVVLEPEDVQKEDTRKATTENISLAKPEAIAETAPKEVTHVEPTSKSQILEKQELQKEETSVAVFLKDDVSKYDITSMLKAESSYYELKELEKDTVKVEQPEIKEVEELQTEKSILTGLNTQGPEPTVRKELPQSEKLPSEQLIEAESAAEDIAKPVPQLQNVEEINSIEEYLKLEASKYDIAKMLQAESIYYEVREFEREEKEIPSQRIMSEVSVKSSIKQEPKNEEIVAEMVPENKKQVEIEQEQVGIDVAESKNDNEPPKVLEYLEITPAIQEEVKAPEEHSEAVEPEPSLGGAVTPIEDIEIIPTIQEEVKISDERSEETQPKSFVIETLMLTEATPITMEPEQKTEIVVGQNIFQEIPIHQERTEEDKHWMEIIETVIKDVEPSEEVIQTEKMEETKQLEEIIPGMEITETQQVENQPQADPIKQTLQPEESLLQETIQAIEIKQTIEAATTDDVQALEEPRSEPLTIELGPLEMCQKEDNNKPSLVEDMVQDFVSYDMPQMLRAETEYQEKLERGRSESREDEEKLSIEDTPKKHIEPESSTKEIVSTEKNLLKNMMQEIITYDVIQMVKAENDWYEILEQNKQEALESQDIGVSNINDTVVVELVSNQSEREISEPVQPTKDVDQKHSQEKTLLENMIQEYIPYDMQQMDKAEREWQERLERERSQSREPERIEFEETIVCQPKLNSGLIGEHQSPEHTPEIVSPTVQEELAEHQPVVEVDEITQVNPHAIKEQSQKIEQQTIPENNDIHEIPPVTQKILDEETTISELEITSPTLQEEPATEHQKVDEVVTAEDALLEINQSVPQETAVEEQPQEIEQQMMSDEKETKMEALTPQNTSFEITITTLQEELVIPDQKAVPPEESIPIKTPEVKEPEEIITVEITEEIPVLEQKLESKVVTETTTEDVSDLLTEVQTPKDNVSEITAQFLIQEGAVSEEPQQLISQELEITATPGLKEIGSDELVPQDASAVVQEQELVRDELEKKRKVPMEELTTQIALEESITLEDAEIETSKVVNPVVMDEDLSDDSIPDLPIAAMMQRVSPQELSAEEVAPVEEEALAEEVQPISKTTNEEPTAKEESLECKMSIDKEETSTSSFVEGTSVLGQNLLPIEIIKDEEVLIEQKLPEVVTSNDPGSILVQSEEVWSEDIAEINVITEKPLSMSQEELPPPEESQKGTISPEQTESTPETPDKKLLFKLDFEVITTDSLTNNDTSEGADVRTTITSAKPLEIDDISEQTFEMIDIDDSGLSMGYTEDFSTKSETTDQKYDTFELDSIQSPTDTTSFEQNIDFPQETEVAHKIETQEIKAEIADDSKKEPSQFEEIIKTATEFVPKKGAFKLNPNAQIFIPDSSQYTKSYTEETYLNQPEVTSYTCQESVNKLPQEQLDSGFEIPSDQANNVWVSEILKDTEAEMKEKPSESMESITPWSTIEEPQKLITDTSKSDLGDHSGEIAMEIANSVIETHDEHIDIVFKASNQETAEMQQQELKPEKQKRSRKKKSRSPRPKSTEKPKQEELEFQAPEIEQEVVVQSIWLTPRHDGKTYAEVVASNVDKRARSTSREPYTVEATLHLSHPEAGDHKDEVESEIPEKLEIVEKTVPDFIAVEESIAPIVVEKCEIPINVEEPIVVPQEESQEQQPPSDDSTKLTVPKKRKSRSRSRSKKKAQQLIEETMEATVEPKAEEITPQETQKPVETQVVEETSKVTVESKTWIIEEPQQTQIEVTLEPVQIDDSAQEVIEKVEPLDETLQDIGNEFETPSEIIPSKLTHIVGSTSHLTTYAEVVAARKDQPKSEIITIKKEVTSESIISEQPKQPQQQILEMEVVEEPSFEREPSPDNTEGFLTVLTKKERRTRSTSRSKQKDLKKKDTSPAPILPKEEPEKDIQIVKQSWAFDEITTAQSEQLEKEEPKEEKQRRPKKRKLQEQVVPQESVKQEETYKIEEQAQIVAIPKSKEVEEIKDNEVTSLLEAERQHLIDEAPKLLQKTWADIVASKTPESPKLKEQEPVVKEDEIKPVVHEHEVLDKVSNDKPFEKIADITETVDVENKDEIVKEPVIETEEIQQKKEIPTKSPKKKKDKKKTADLCDMFSAVKHALTPSKDTSVIEIPEDLIPSSPEDHKKDRKKRKDKKSKGKTHEEEPVVLTDMLESKPDPTLKEPEGVIGDCENVAEISEEQAVEIAPIDEKFEEVPLTKEDQKVNIDDFLANERSAALENAPVTRKTSEEKPSSPKEEKEGFFGGLISKISEKKKTKKQKKRQAEKQTKEVQQTEDIVEVKTNDESVPEKEDITAAAVQDKPTPQDSQTSESETEKKHIGKKTMARERLTSESEYSETEEKRKSGVIGSIVSKVSDALSGKRKKKKDKKKETITVQEATGNDFDSNTQALEESIEKVVQKEKDRLEKSEVLTPIKTAETNLELKEEKPQEKKPKIPTEIESSIIMEVPTAIGTIEKEIEEAMNEITFEEPDIGEENRKEANKDDLELPKTPESSDFIMIEKSDLEEKSQEIAEDRADTGNELCINLSNDGPFWLSKSVYEEAEELWRIYINQSYVPVEQIILVQKDDTQDKDGDGDSGHSSGQDSPTRKQFDGSFMTSYTSADLPGGMCRWKDESTYLAFEEKKDEVLMKETIEKMQTEEETVDEIKDIIPVESGIEKKIYQNVIDQKEVGVLDEGFEKLEDEVIPKEKADVTVEDKIEEIGIQTDVAMAKNVQQIRDNEDFVEDIEHENDTALEINLLQSKAEGETVNLEESKNVGEVKTEVLKKYVEDIDKQKDEIEDICRHIIQVESGAEKNIDQIIELQKEISVIVDSFKKLEDEEIPEEKADATVNDTLEEIGIQTADVAMAKNLQQMKGNEDFVEDIEHENDTVLEINLLQSKTEGETINLEESKNVGEVKTEVLKKYDEDIDIQKDEIEDISKDIKTAEKNTDQIIEVQKEIGIIVDSFDKLKDEEIPDEKVDASVKDKLEEIGIQTVDVTMSKNLEQIKNNEDLIKDIKQEIDTILEISILKLETEGKIAPRRTEHGPETVNLEESEVGTMTLDKYDEDIEKEGIEAEIELQEEIDDKISKSVDDKEQFKKVAQGTEDSKDRKVTFKDIVFEDYEEVYEMDNLVRQGDKKEDMKDISSKMIEIESVVLESLRPIEDVAEEVSIQDTEQPVKEEIGKVEQPEEKPMGEPFESHIIKQKTDENPEDLIRNISSDGTSEQPVVIDNVSDLDNELTSNKLSDISPDINDDNLSDKICAIANEQTLIDKDSSTNKDSDRPILVEHPGTIPDANQSLGPSVQHLPGGVHVANTTTIMTIDAPPLSPDTNTNDNLKKVTYGYDVYWKVCMHLMPNTVHIIDRAIHNTHNRRNIFYL